MCFDVLADAAYFAVLGTTRGSNLGRTDMPTSHTFFCLDLFPFSKSSKLSVSFLHWPLLFPL